MTQPIGANAPTGPELATQYLARTLSLQKRVMTEAGEQTLKLIQSAAVLPPEQGRQLDVRA